MNCLFCLLCSLLLHCCSLHLVQCMNIARMDANQDTLVYINGQPLQANSVLSFDAYQQLFTVVMPDGTQVPPSVRYLKSGVYGGQQQLRLLYQPTVVHMRIMVVRVGQAGPSAPGGIAPSPPPPLPSDNTGPASPNTGAIVPPTIAPISPSSPADTGSTDSATTEQSSSSTEDTSNAPTDGTSPPQDISTDSPSQSSTDSPTR